MNSLLDCVYTQNSYTGFETRAWTCECFEILAFVCRKQWHAGFCGLSHMHMNAMYTVFRSNTHDNESVRYLQVLACESPAFSCKYFDLWVHARIKLALTRIIMKKCKILACSSSYDNRAIYCACVSARLKASFHVSLAEMLSHARMCDSWRTRASEREIVKSVVTTTLRVPACGGVSLCGQVR